MAVSVSSTEAQEGQATSGFWALTLGSIGVVFGDIGTSPLYAFREAVGGAAHGQPVTRIMVLGVLSLILWALFTVVTAKYVLLLLRADNNGEGGTLSLMALGQRAIGRRSWPLLVLGVIGASMFIGDSMITPAISVLSAVEGLKLATPHLEHYVVPLTILILVLLFSVQSSGTARVASAFGPVMVVWFATLAAMGLAHISDNPSVLAAINPYYAVQFMLTHGTIGLVTLGAVFLAVTGGEALYADLGHFGRKPIQSGWLFFVLPALLLNYFGQGALVLSDPAAIENSFYRMVPDVLLLPLVVLATVATVIASQAVITGAYSLISQAVQLGLLPRFEVRYTSETHAGQIYLPRVNRLLLVGVLLLVLLFRTSSGLASAYGIAVSTTMVADGIMGFIVIWKLWNWRVASAAVVILPFVIVDMTFFSANLLKLLEGAWVPLLFGATVAIMIWTWLRGAAILVAKTRRTEVPLRDLIQSLEKRPPHIVKGTAVFLTSDPNFVPTALLHNLKHNKVLHEHNVVLTIETAPTPRVDLSERVHMAKISDKFSTVRLRFGYMESPNVPKALAIARKLGWQFDIMATSFFVSRRSLKPAAQSGMPQWQDHLFIAMSRSANDAIDYFQIPTGRVVEVGTQVTI
ncbi:MULTISPECIES: potassium transporter Kup [unclassified Bradyrhizobium]|uniref:potassium transporter Kup n=1 Tax=unclassified Bradyrhizobium TaxID=2631580 RepID=UPI002479A8D8|nr:MULTISPECIES: potassium transporter Kup [unclassified Bradyrhizobium]WGR92530.1 potassium transporter Kup [Bradyrhizobium sp. ISRA435]WGR96940.1 potassium transporter Kup [Bradyrhizobium sp. ISRA436]WGS03827.1 potassium transporter Kup [Bradyrhizobium sp. ISRA437]WGS10711.1 potassium transporter Kup [Bradyrhizobium sp. ISRA443]WGS17973.1 potassium transporter Kup [Bradyrhizobium sp. ISRA463]